MNREKFIPVEGCKIVQFDDAQVDAIGVTDESMTVVAVAVARPGRTNWAKGNTPYTEKRTLQRGDVEIYGLIVENVVKDKKGNITKIIGKNGPCVMNTKAWILMQSRNKDTGQVNDPFMINSWSATTRTFDRNGEPSNLRAPIVHNDMKLLHDAAINAASVELAEKVEKGTISRAQSEYAEAAAAGVKMAKAMENRQPARSRQEERKEDITNGAITPDDLDGI